MNKPVKTASTAPLSKYFLSFTLDISAGNIYNVCVELRYESAKNKIISNESEKIYVYYRH